MKYAPLSRQTMLFSATMTSKVEDLVRMSLKRPVRVRITGNVYCFIFRGACFFPTAHVDFWHTTICARHSGNNGDTSNGSISFAPRLVQEFIKVRSASGAVVQGEYCC